MKRVIKGLVLWSLIFLFSFCQNKPTSHGDLQVQVFHDQLVHFAPDSSALERGDLLRLMNGRLWLRKIKIPGYEKPVKITLKVSLQSNGDRWDKSGSCFVIPAESEINFRTIAAGQAQFPPGITADSLKGVAPDSTYLPVIELMRFMTPFGVGYYSKQMDERRPAFVARWADSVVWQEDVSHLISRLPGEVWVGIWIDSWTKEGYKVNVSLHFDEDEFACRPAPVSRVLPLLNTVPYMAGQKLVDTFARQDLEVPFNLPKGAKNLRLYYITTGHGGHAGGDEFTRQRNRVFLDDQPVLDFIPWRDDCASFRRFNPTSGVWLVPDTMRYYDWQSGKPKTETIRVPLASSDLSRSNWCPGSDVPPLRVDLHPLQAGEHVIRFSIPHAQPAEGNKLNHWLVSSYLYWEL